MSLYYSSLNKKMAAQADDRAYEQEASERQIEAQQKLKIEKKLKTINESILTKLIQKVDQQKMNDNMQERIDFKNVQNDSTIDGVSFDDNIITVESFRKVLFDDRDLQQAAAKLAAVMRVKNKFLTNKRFDANKFITSLNVSGIKQGAVNNILHEAGYIKFDEEEASKPRRKGRQKKTKSDSSE